jgi:hypothetical protein
VGILKLSGLITMTLGAQLKDTILNSMGRELIEKWFVHIGCMEDNRIMAEQCVIQTALKKRIGMIKKK